MITKDYKPYIDGLRALAVLPVIFFHADFKFFNGGFVGVDIFFVISGYLITNIIIQDLYKKKFSLKKFYLRRARRILPVLYFVTFISLLISMFIMTNEQLNFFSIQVISVILFISNFFFWRNTGYFDPNSEIQPLLHTWSLGVEEQFYIFFPIFLIFVWSFLKKKLVFLLIAISLLSLLLSQIGGNFKIQNISSEFPFMTLPFDFFWQAGSANFYLPFGRIWELLVGSLISIFLNRTKILDQKTNNYFSILGFFLIIVSILSFTENVQYPSVFTIFPVLGSALLIIYSTKSTLSYKILSYKPLVFLGLISFSLYLWHQPLLAFNRIFFGVELSFIHKLSLIIITIIFSLFSWKFIEKPFRDKKAINDKNIILILFFTSLIILILSFLIYSSKINSIKEPLPQNIIKSFQSEKSDNCFDLKYAHLENKKWFCEIGDQSSNYSFAVIGDSHALSLKPAFNYAGLSMNKKGIFTGFSGCPGLLGINSIRSDQNIKNCKLLNEKLFNFVINNEIKKVFLVSKWGYYTVGNLAKTHFNLISKDGNLFSNKQVSKSAFIYGIQKTLKRYENYDVEVVFIHQVPEQIYDPLYVFQKSFDNKKKEIRDDKLISFSINYNKFIEHQKFIRNSINNIKKEFTILKEIDFDDIFCNNLKCSIGSKNGSYYSDTNHLSINGALKTVNKLMKLIK